MIRRTSIFPSTTTSISSVSGWPRFGFAVQNYRTTRSQRKKNVCFSSCLFAFSIQQIHQLHRHSHLLSSTYNIRKDILENKVIMVSTTGSVLLAPSPDNTKYDFMYYLKGAAAGGICCSITHGALTPVDVVKTRVQLDPVKVSCAFGSMFSSFALVCLFVSVF
jgi:hypothetical protein